MNSYLWTMNSAISLDGVLCFCDQTISTACSKPTPLTSPAKVSGCIRLHSYRLFSVEWLGRILEETKRVKYLNFQFHQWTMKELGISGEVNIG